MQLLKPILFIALLCVMHARAQDDDNDDLLNDEDANSFYEKRELDLLKRFFYSGQEQRREVRERYEEKCERSIFHRSRPRWCPELDTWPEWVAISKNDPPHKKLTNANGK